jgi:hypothetical protein
MNDVASGLWQRVRRPAAAVMLTAALGAGSAAAAFGSPGDSMSQSGSAGAQRLGAVQGVRLSAAAPVSRTIPLAAAQPLGARRLVLEIGDITFTAPPSVAYDVYVDLPPGAAPDPHGPHHVGSLTFYGLDGRRPPAHGHAPGQRYDITSAARAPGAAPAAVSVTLVPFELVTTSGGAPAAPRGSNVVIGRIEVRAVEPPR